MQGLWPIQIQMASVLGLDGREIAVLYAIAGEMSSELQVDSLESLFLTSVQPQFSWFDSQSMWYTENTHLSGGTLSGKIG